MAAHTLETLGADADLQHDLAVRLVDAPAGSMAGRVSRIDRGRFQMLTAAGPVAEATTGVSPVCVGDWCIVRAVPSP